METTLITSYFKSKSQQRHKEYLVCLEKNAKNKFIDTIILVLEDENKPTHKDLGNLTNEQFNKIVFSYNNARPTFRDCIKIANLEVANSKQVIICNSDIYFDDSIEFITEQLNSNTVLALTRWDLNSSGEIEFFRNLKSQDSWVFNTALPEDIGNYYFGHLGCDNKFNYELVDREFEVKNPSFSIRSIHLHISSERTYIDNNIERIPPPYYFPLATGSKSIVSVLFYKIFYKEKYKQHKINFELYLFMRTMLLNAKVSNFFETSNLNKIERFFLLFLLKLLRWVYKPLYGIYRKPN